MRASCRMRDIHAKTFSVNSPTFASMTSRKCSEVSLLLAQFLLEDLRAAYILRRMT